MQAGYLPAPYYSGSAGLRDPCARNLSSLYAFGPAAGDASANSDDDVVQLSFPGTGVIYFAGASYPGVCVYSNSAVTFLPADSGAACVPTANSFPPMTPPYGDLGPGVILFWTDIDTSTPISSTGYASAVQNTQYSEEDARRGLTLR